MKLSLFPVKEFTLKSNYTSSEILDVLNANVMSPVTFTIGILSKMLDEKKGQRRYFEGVVNDDDFTINYKSYHYGSPLRGMSFIPQIHGALTATKEGTAIRVVFFSNTPLSVLSIFFIPMFIIVTFMALAEIQIALLFFCLVFLIISWATYRYRIGAGLEKLKDIFKAT